MSDNPDARWTRPEPTTGPYVAVRPDGCHQCGGPLTTQAAGQPALFRHGGYGATVTTMRRWCPTCGWDAGDHRTETRPDR